MSNAFEYGDALLPRPEGADGEDSPTLQVEPNQPYLSLATFRMVLLADEVLESFFETDLSSSFRLEPVPLMELPSTSNGFLGGLWSNIATDSNVKLFHKFSDEVGKTIGRHQVIHRPSIGRYTSVEDTRPRESLLTSPIRSSPSKSSLRSSSTTASTTSHLAAETKSQSSSGSSATAVALTATTTTLDVETSSSLYPTSPAGFDPLAQATNAAYALMERTPFAIDDAGDDDEDEDDEGESVQDDVLDEVCFLCLSVCVSRGGALCSLLSTLWQVDAFLEAHDTGVTDADREVAKGE
jgi:TBC1 domain family member 8/9